MKKFHRSIAKTIACMLLIAMTTSIAGAAITESRNGEWTTAMNTKRGVLTNEELQTFFTDNQELLQSIATQLIPLYEETELYVIYKRRSQIVAQDGDIQPLTLDDQLLKQLEQYFDATGSKNEPEIFAREIVGGFIIVEFSFQLAIGHNKGIMYSIDPEAQAEWEERGYERLEDNWFIFEYFMDGKPIMPPWYTRLPRWLHWLLYYVFFGWAWMD